MDARTKRRIERLASTLLLENNSHEPGFDIYALLDNLDIKYLHKDLGPTVYGASKVEGDKKIIALNNTNAPTRQRFTAAHELGHLFLHHERELSYSDRLLFRNSTSSEGSDPREVEANYFAASLLMPECLLEREISGLKYCLDESDIEMLATKFNVSSIAMSIRLSSIGFI